MTKRTAKPKKPSNSRASFSRAELCKMLDTDPRTIDRRCKKLGIESRRSGKGKTASIVYDLTPDQLDQLRQPLARGYGSGTPDSDLKQEKLRLEAEHLALKNKKLRAESTSNVLMAQFLEASLHAIPAMIQARLITYSEDAAGKEPAEIREIGRKANDEIRAGISAFFKEWEPKFEGQD